MSRSPRRKSIKRRRYDRKAAGRFELAPVTDEQLAFLRERSGPVIAIGGVPPRELVLATGLVLVLGRGPEYRSLGVSPFASNPRELELLED